jgi:outer membrane protein assembly factor BamB
LPPESALVIALRAAENPKQYLTLNDFKGRIMISPRACRLGCVLLVAAATRLTWSQSATTNHYDNYRTGWNPNETILTPAVVGGSNFGLLQSVPLDDQVDSQPLYMPAVNVTAGPYRGTHDVVYVATENNTLYAIDAKSGTVLLSSDFGPPIPRPLGATTMAQM